MIFYLTHLHVSDVCGGWPGLGPYASVQALHFLIGALAVAMPSKWREAGFFIWLGKEVFADISGCGFSMWVVLDSVLDMTIAMFGFAAAQFILRHRRTRKPKAGGWMRPKAHSEAQR